MEVFPIDLPHTMDPNGAQSNMLAKGDAYLTSDGRFHYGSGAIGGMAFDVTVRRDHPLYASLKMRTDLGPGSIAPEGGWPAFLAVHPHAAPKVEATQAEEPNQPDNAAARDLGDVLADRLGAPQFTESVRSLASPGASRAPATTPSSRDIGDRIADMLNAPILEGR